MSWICVWRVRAALGEEEKQVTHFSSFYLELGDHVLLGVVRHALVAEQPAPQMLLVVPFKDILLLHESEQHHGLVKDRLHLLLCQLIV